MVRERVGDWQLAWRFALAGVIAGLLVISLAQTGVTSGTFDRGQGKLFPALTTDPGITFVEIDSRTQKDLGAYPWVPMPTEAAMPAYNAKRQLYATQSVFV